MWWTSTGEQCIWERGNKGHRAYPEDNLTKSIWSSFLSLCVHLRLCCIRAPQCPCLMLTADLVNNRSAPSCSLFECRVFRRNMSWYSLLMLRLLQLLRDSSLFPPLSEMYNRLSPLQIIGLLNVFTPQKTLEEFQDVWVLLRPNITWCV